MDGIKEQKHRYHGSPNSTCLGCDNARRDIDHVRCSAVKLTVLVGRSGKPFLTDPTYHCKCFRDNPELHYKIASQLTPKDIISSIKLKPKPDDFEKPKINLDESKDIINDNQITLD